VYEARRGYDGISGLPPFLLLSHINLLFREKPTSESASVAVRLSSDLPKSCRRCRGVASCRVPPRPPPAFRRRLSRELSPRVGGGCLEPDDRLVQEIQGFGLTKTGAAPFRAAFSSATHLVHPESNMARIEPLERDKLGPRQQQLYDDIMRTRPRGKLSGPF